MPLPKRRSGSTPVESEKALLLRMRALEARVAALEAARDAWPKVRSEPLRPAAAPRPSPRCPGCNLALASRAKKRCPWCGFALDALAR